MRWSGHGAPTWLTSGALAEEAKATASGLRSTSRTTPAESARRAPRRAGSAAARRSSASGSPSCVTLRPAEAEARPAARADRLGSAGDELERGRVALGARLAPGDEPVLLEQHGARLRVRLEQLGDPLRHGEAGPLVVEPDGLVAERLLGESPPVGRGRERDDRVGVRVVDVRRRRRTRAAASRSTAAAGRARARSGGGSRPSRRRPSRRARRSGRISSSRSAAKPAGVIVARSVPEPLTQRTRVSRPAWSAATPLRGRVPAALVGERAVGPEQVRAVGERLERVEPGDRGSRPRGRPAPRCRGGRRWSRSRAHLLRDFCESPSRWKRSQASSHSRRPAGS